MALLLGWRGELLSLPVLFDENLFEGERFSFFGFCNFSMMMGDRRSPTFTDSRGWVPPTLDPPMGGTTLKPSYFGGGWGHVVVTSSRSVGRVVQRRILIVYF